MSDKQLIYRFFDVFNHRDPKQMSELLTPDAELCFPKTEPLLGKERIFKFLNILFRQYPVLTFTVERVILQQNQAAVLRRIDRQTLIVFFDREPSHDIPSSVASG